MESKNVRALFRAKNVSATKRGPEQSGRTLAEVLRFYPRCDWDYVTELYGELDQEARRTDKSTKVTSATKKKIDPAATLNNGRGRQIFQKSSSPSTSAASTSSSGSSRSRSCGDFALVSPIRPVRATLRNLCPGHSAKLSRRNSLSSSASTVSTASSSSSKSKPEPKVTADTALDQFSQKMLALRQQLDDRRRVAAKAKPKRASVRADLSSTFKVTSKKQRTIQRGHLF